MTEIEERLAQIQTEMTAEGADIEALTAEVDELMERRKAIQQEEAEKREQLAQKVAAGTTPVHVVEERKSSKMTAEEIRGSEEYLEAYANAIKKGDDTFKECRTLLSENADGGTVLVPTVVEGYLQHNLDRFNLLKRVSRISVKGNVTFGLETSATAAVYHVEGTAAPDEEVLTLDKVQLIPTTIKKWIKISSEVYEMDAINFVEYIFNEIANQIYLFAETKIAEALTEGAAYTSVSAVGLGDVFTAIAALSDEAEAPVVICSRSTYAAYRTLAVNANYAVDPFDGLEVVLAPVDGLIVADLSAVTVNFPLGDDISFITDSYSLAEEDLVKIVGKLPFAVGVTKLDRISGVKVG